MVAAVGRGRHGLYPPSLCLLSSTGIRIFENWWEDVELGDESGMWETMKTRKLIVRSTFDHHGFSRWTCILGLHFTCEVQAWGGKGHPWCAMGHRGAGDPESRACG